MDHARGFVAAGSFVPISRVSGGGCDKNKHKYIRPHVRRRRGGIDELAHPASPGLGGLTPLPSGGLFSAVC